MHCENFVINKRSNWHAIENVLELFPKSNGVASLAFIVEAIDTINLTTFVVSTEQKEVFLEFYFVGQEQNYRLQRLLASVDVVTQEEVVGLRWVPAILEQA